MKAGLPIQADTDICLHKWHHQRDQRGVHAWPLLTVETEVNEVSKRTNERGPFLGWFVGLVVSVQEIFVLPHGCSQCSGRPYTISITLSPSPSKLGRQPCWVSCLLVCVSGHPSPRCIWLYLRERSYKQIRILAEKSLFLNDLFTEHEYRTHSHGHKCILDQLKE